MKNRSSLVQCLFSVGVILSLFFLHSYFNSYFHWVHHDFLIRSYLIILCLTFIFFGLFTIAKNKVPDHLGFLYLFWVLIKFILLFFLFYTEINNDPISKRAEVISLLIPYLISIFLSAFPLSRELNRQ